MSELDELELITTLADEVWNAVKYGDSLISDWDCIDDIVTQALSTWDKEALIEEAERFGVDTSEYKEDLNE